MAVPSFYMCGYIGAGDFSSGEQNSLEHFTVDDLLEIPNDDASMADGFLSNDVDSAAVTPVGSCNSSVSGGDTLFSTNIAHLDTDLCIPYEDMAELEWLSNFVEDSFSAGEDLRGLHLVAGWKSPTPESCFSDSNAHFFPGKARSKRSRATPGVWSTRLLHLAPEPKSEKNETPARNSAGGRDSGISCRKCLHCAAEKTPQWRTGPMGPKTLCNACGVRFKSGRLVPEYRPAASPTFTSARHSNSHRKVLEMRRQKDFISQSSVFAASNGVDEYLIHKRHPNGPDYRHMI